MRVKIITYSHLKEDIWELYLFTIKMRLLVLLFIVIVIIVIRLLFVVAVIVIYILWLLQWYQTFVYDYLGYFQSLFSKLLLHFVSVLH